MFRWMRQPLSAPREFTADGAQPFADAWSELDRALRPQAHMAPTLEMAARLLAEVRLTDPDKFPTDRLRLLRNLLQDLRS